MSSHLRSIALFFLVGACAPAKVDFDKGGSGLSSVTIGSFKTADGKTNWKKMNLSITPTTDSSKAKKLSFDVADFKTANSGKAVNDTIKLAKGDYLFVAEYLDADSKAMYRSCKADAAAPKRVEGTAATVQITVCLVADGNPAGKTDLEDISISIETKIGTETSGPSTTVPSSSVPNDKQGDMSSTPAKPADSSTPAPATPSPAPAAGDATKGKATIASKCAGCHVTGALGAKVVLNASVIPKLENTQGDELKIYHSALKDDILGAGRPDLEAALKANK